MLSLEHSQVVIWIPAMQARQKKYLSLVINFRWKQVRRCWCKFWKASKKYPRVVYLIFSTVFHYWQSVSFAYCHSTRFPQKLINKNTRQYNYGVCCRFIKNPAVIFSSKSFQTSKTKNDKKIIKVSFYEMLNPLTPKISSVTLLTASTQLLWC